MLANIYLHRRTRYGKKKMQKRLEPSLRYAEDIVVLCRKGTELPMKSCGRYWSDELTLN